MRADDGSELFGAVGFQSEPGLERPEAPRQIRSEFARPWRARGKASGLAAQIRRRRGERLAVLPAVANHQEAGVVRHLSPFVEIKRDRIGIFQSSQPRRQHRRENSERAIGAIDVKPELLLAAQRAQRLEIVDGADIHRSGRADHQKRFQAGVAILRDTRAQRRDIDAMTVDRSRCSVAHRCRSRRDPWPSRYSRAPRSTYRPSATRLHHRGRAAEPTARVLPFAPPAPP